MKAQRSLEEGLSVKRFCEVVEMSRATFYRRKAGLKRSGASRRQRPPAEVVAAIRETALAHPVWGYRRVWASLRHLELSCWQVQRTMKEEGLALPSNWAQKVRERTQAQREYLHKQAPSDQRVVAARSHPDLDRGLGALLGDQRGGLLLALCAGGRAALSPHQRAVDLITALEGALAEARRYHELPQDRKIVLVKDNGPSLKSGKFAQFIERSLFVHVGERASPANDRDGGVERFHQSYKYEEVYLYEYREPIEAAEALARYRWHYNKDSGRRRP